MNFPKDCWNTQCEYQCVYDLSIDDLVIVCKLLNLECDLCDIDITCPTKCPKSITEVENV